MRSRFGNEEEGVSPVVGVMLMLVVTIIIAAVVSAYAGGISAGQKKAPSASIEFHVVNNGGSLSQFTMKVLSVSEPIPTKDLKLITSWRNQSGGIGGSISQYGGMNTNYYSTLSSTTTYQYNAPIGYGAGIANQTNSVPYNQSQWFGNYTLVTGTVATNWPCSQYGNGTKYVYNPDWVAMGGAQDSLTGILGKEWNSLRPGDVVNIKLVHLPSGKVIVNNDVTVEGA